MLRGSKTTGLRDRLRKALRAERHDEALRLYKLLIERDKQEPRWPHRMGDLLQRMNRNADAIEAYECAVDLYAAQGFVARAAAMAKVIMSIDSKRVDVLERVHPEEARRLHRANRNTIVTADEWGEGDVDGVPTNTQNLVTDALPLISDTTAAPDEVRFAESSGAQIDLDMTDIELLDRPAIDKSIPSLRPSAEALAQLPSMPLFAEVPREVLTTLVRESTLVDLSDDQRLVTAGTTADALFVLVEGNAMAQRGLDRRPLLLGEGDLAGVSCLLADVNYCEDVTSCGELRALRISKLLLDRLVAEYPAVGDVLLEVLGRRLVASLLRTSPLFAKLDDGTRARVARMFEVRKAAPGTKLLEVGKRSDGMYVPLLGRLVATGPDGAFIGELKLGRALGQQSLLTRQPALFTAEAQTDLLVLRISSERFSDLLLTQGDLVSKLQASARRPMAQRCSVVPIRPRRA